jgi:putative membrane protein
VSQPQNNVIRHYSSLFTLPPYKQILLFLILLCFAGSLSFSIILFSQLRGILIGLVLGLSFFLISFISDNITSKWVFKNNQIYDLRRIEALSLFCWILWFSFLFAGALFSLLLHSSLWIQFCLLGFSAVLILRLIVFKTTVYIKFKNLIFASFFQPFFCLLLFLYLWSMVGNISFNIIIFCIYSPIICLLSSFLFTYLLNADGKIKLGVSSLSLFKAFLLNWIADLNAPLEEFLERLGEDKLVNVSVLKFDTSKPKAIMIVPSIHPGPFKNVGSSLLPSMIKFALEKKLKCIACVPHGLLSHEFDLTSQNQNKRIIENILKSANFKSNENKATPFVTSSNGLATASCQIFGSSAFISFTLAPKTTEDFPTELGQFINQKIQKYGLSYYTVVNAHNSIDGPVDPKQALDALKSVGELCLKKAASFKRLPFEVGASTFTLKEYGIKDGIGPGGITVLVVKVATQKTAYIIIDGNNLVSGLREKIISALESIGINKSEIFTTDTHCVNAVTLNIRGYNPVGETINHDKLIHYIKEATKNALATLERVKVASKTFSIPGIRVIGQKTLEALCIITDKTIKKAKRIAIPIFGAASLFLIAFLIFL